MPTKVVSAAAETLKGNQTETRKALIDQSMPDMYPDREDE